VTRAAGIAPPQAIVSKNPEMSQALAKRRRNDNLRNWAASVAVALAPALLLGALLAAVMPGPWRNAAVYACLFFMPCLCAGARVGPTLVARYDGQALMPPPAAQQGLQQAGPLDMAQQHAWTALQSWCQAGTGDGRTPFWHPWRLPDMPERLGLAVMAGRDGDGASRLVAAFARHLDQDDRLAALSAVSRLKGWRLKLAVKWNELWWWRRRHPRQPWDCGYLVEGPAAQDRLAYFRPRRPTLIVADALRGDSLEPVLQALAAAKADYRHPVRLLMIDAGSQYWPARVYDPGQVKVIEFDS